MRLGLVAYLTCVFSTADAGPLQITQAANEDFVAQVRATRELRLDEIALEIDGERLVTPWQIGSWQRFGAPIAVTLLVQGSSFWIGTDEITAVDAFHGTLPELAVELDRLNFHVLPPRSRMTIASYSDRVRYLAETIAGAFLGSQRDHYGNTGTQLSDAIETVARDMFVREPRFARNVIVVLGDGCDEASSERRRALKGWLAGYGIELHAVTYKSRWSCDGNPVHQLTTNVTQVTTIENLAAAAHHTINTLDDRTFVRFDGAKLPWDGETHAYVVIAGDERFGPVFRTLPDRREHTDWTWWLIASGMLLALIVLSFVIRRWHRSATAILR